MDHSRTLLIVLSLVTLASATAVAGDPLEYTLIADDVSGAPGASVDVSVKIEADVDAEEFGGFSFGLQHDDIFVVTDVSAGDALDEFTACPECLIVDLDPEVGPGFTVEAYFDLKNAMGHLPGDETHELVIATYDIDSEAENGTYTLAFEDENVDILVLQYKSEDTAPATSDGSITVGTSVPFRRLDVNDDGRVDVGDVVAIISVFVGGLEASNNAVDCADAYDINDSGNLSIADALIGFLYVFGSADPPAEPFDDCDSDPTEDDLGCESFPECAPT